MVMEVLLKATGESARSNMKLSAEAGGLVNISFDDGEEFTVKTEDLFYAAKAFYNINKIENTNGNT